MPAGPIEDVAFWAAGDLGNMAGPRRARAPDGQATERCPTDRDKRTI
jgi:hypothetical protein